MPRARDVGPQQDAVAVPGLDELGARRDEGRVGPVLVAAGAVVAEVGAALGDRRMQARIRVPVRVRDRHPVRGDAAGLEHIEQFVDGRAALGVHHDRGARGAMRLGDRLERDPLGGGDAPVVRAGLEHAGAHGRAVGAGCAGTV